MDDKLRRVMHDFEEVIRRYQKRLLNEKIK